MSRCNPRGDVQEAAEATGLDLWLSGERVSESLGRLFRGFRSLPDHRPFSCLTGVVPVLLNKQPPQQQQAQKGAEAQHQEQSGHQGDPGCGTKNRQISNASCWSPAPRSGHPRPGPAPPHPRAPRASARQQHACGRSSASHCTGVFRAAAGRWLLWSCPCSHPSRKRSPPSLGPTRRSRGLGRWGRGAWRAAVNGSGSAGAAPKSLLATREAAPAPAQKSERVVRQWELVGGWASIDRRRLLDQNPTVLNSRGSPKELHYRKHESRRKLGR